MLYAIAARVVVANPDGVGEVTQRLAMAGANLVPPESVTAAECSRLWLLFVRFLRAARPPARVEAGKAFLRDLEAVGQRLELPPLPGWDRLPQGVNDPNAVSTEWSEVTSQGETLEAIRGRAKARAVDLKGLEATEVAQLVRSLYVAERDALLTKLVGEGVMSRSEVGLLVRWLAKGEKLADDDSALIEVFGRLGAWLAR